MKKLILLAGLSVQTAFAAEVGVVLSNLSDKFVTYLRDGIIRYQEENEDLRITIVDAGGDSANVMNQIENLISKKVDAILLQPTDRKIVRSIGKKLEQANIPLVVINHYPESDALKYLGAYVGSKEKDAGILQAEAVSALLNGEKAEVGILLGPLGLEAQTERTSGNKEVFSQFPNIKIVAEQEAKWDRATAMRIVEDWLQAHSNMNVIVANNDEMAIGALLAVEKLGKKDSDFIIAGVDATPDALAYLGRGLDITIFQDASKQGYEGLKSAHALVLKNKTEKELWIPFETVTPDKKEIYENRYKP